MLIETQESRSSGQVGVSRAYPGSWL